MKNKLQRIEDLRTSKQALMKGEITLEEFHEEIDEFRTEKFLRLSDAMPTFMTEIPEVKKLIILIDIVGFSKSSTREQVYNIYLFQRYLVSKVLSNKLSFGKQINISQFIPTGDGCYIVADECDPDVALSFLVTLIGGFRQIVSEDGKNLSLRASALFGSCVPFIDLARHKNYVGEGMNEAARILSCGQAEIEKMYMQEHPEAVQLDAKMYSRNSLYLGDSLKENIQNYKDSFASDFYFPEVADKHGCKRNITVLQGISFFNNNSLHNSD